MITKCPTELTLINYLENKNNEIEQHLIHCDKCLNTIIYLTKNKKEIESFRKQEYKIVNNPFYKQSIAASILFLSLFFVFENNNNINTQILTENDIKTETEYYKNYMTDFNQEFNQIVYSEDEILIQDLTNFKDDIFSTSTTL